jgi:hypothetical protein
MSYVRFVLLASLLLPGALRAQVPGPVGSEQERLARWLELLGARPPAVGTMRGLTTDGAAWLPQGLAVLPLSASLTGNSGFPYGENDGPLWAGRGVTLGVAGGVSWHRGPLTVVVAPMAFAAQNASFTLMANGHHGDTAYADGRFPFYIDRPQRFGSGVYGRLDPGETAVRLEGGGLAVGATSGIEVWGPAARFPLILGDNAPGIPRVWVGTSRPRDLWLFRLSGRVWWGRLDQSAYAFKSPGNGRRVGSGLVLVAQPRGLPGLEVGGGRFFHQTWPAGGLRLSNFTRVFEGLLKKSLATASDPGGGDADNQLLSIFARWVFAGAGFEVYGEYGREDHSWDLEDLALEPDHSAAYVVGFAKAWRRRDGQVLGLRAEVLNAQQNRLALDRSQPTWYTHSAELQGHTELGQVLGSDAAFGGAGAWVALDRYDERGRWTVSWTRELRGQLGRFLTTGAVNPRGLDVWHALSVERLWRTPRMDVTGALTAVYEMNRDYLRDAFNLNLQMQVTMPIGRFDPRAAGR